MQKYLFPILLLLIAAPASARTTPSNKTATRSFVPLTRQTLNQHFPGISTEGINARLRQRKWRPSQTWLRNEGRKYGRLLVFSDLHMATGRDPLTRRISPYEEFKHDQQEADFVSLLSAQWQQSKSDRKVRSVVVNGDLFELMQTDRTVRGETFSGPRDRFGPSNTPEVAEAKLRAIAAGHPRFFAAIAEHIARGHRFVIVAGNHDRQIIHPHVLSSFRRMLTNSVEAHLVNAAKTDAKINDAAQRQLSARAKELVDEHFELAPWFWMHGDFVARHGNEADHSNAFSTPFAEFYHPQAKNVPMEAAFGDYVVRAFVNRPEFKQPWIDNGARPMQQLWAVLKSIKGNPVTLLRGLGYLLTREGVTADAATRDADLRADISRYVKEFDLAKKFNVLRETRNKLSEAQVVDMLVAYEKQGALAIYSRFKADTGVFTRLGRLLRQLPELIKHPSMKKCQLRMCDALFANGVGVVAGGHDHVFRIESRLRIAADGETVSRADVIDTSTWVDKIPAIRRETGFQTDKTRGVLVVDFDKEGGHYHLMNYDPQRGLQLVNLLEEAPK
ncbi:MAG: hypothetical protein H6707_00735 [Deltaproteobacteria bacterium]|nr:hypothetical protein [Deltaproteobacteria bacterium]